LDEINIGIKFNKYIYTYMDKITEGLNWAQQLSTKKKKKSNIKKKKKKLRF